MSELLENIGSILTSLLSWLGSVATALIGNEIFQIMLAVVLFKLIYNLIKNLINENMAKKLAVELTGNTDELEYYRSLSDEEKEEYNRTHI